MKYSILISNITSNFHKENMTNNNYKVAIVALGLLASTYSTSYGATKNTTQILRQEIRGNQAIAYLDGKKSYSRFAELGDFEFTAKINNDGKVMSVDTFTENVSCIANKPLDFYHSNICNRVDDVFNEIYVRNNQKHKK